MLSRDHLRLVLSFFSFCVLRVDTIQHTIVSSIRVSGVWCDYTPTCLLVVDYVLSLTGMSDPIRQVNHFLLI